MRTKFAWCLTVLLFTTAASAAPIVYTFEGKGSGKIGSTQFNDAAFTVRLTADTDAVARLNEPGFTIFETPTLTGDIQVAGLSDATFNEPQRVFVNQTNRAVGWGTEDEDYIDRSHSSFATYDLRHNFGPRLFPGRPDEGGFGDKPTSMGQVTVVQIHDVTFTAALAPEPSTAGVFLAVGAAMTFRRRSRRGDFQNSFHPV